MVQRYNYNPMFGFTPDVEGGLVLYEDYAKLEAELIGLKEWRAQMLNAAFDFLEWAAKAEAELQKYKDQFPDYVECANCGSVTHVEGVE